MIEGLILAVPESLLLSEVYERRVAVIWDLWPLVYLLTAALIAGFVFWTEGAGISRLQKLAAEVTFGAAAIVVLVAPGALLFGIAWNVTVALSHDLGLVYATTLAPTVGLLTLLLLTARRRIPKG